MTALTIFTISVFAQQTTGFKKKTSKQQSAKVSYYCPMHLDEVSGKPGKCSKCGTTLNLTPKEKMKIYTCPMHADVSSAKPGKCSKCGMDLTIVKDK